MDTQDSLVTVEVIVKVASCVVSYRLVSAELTLRVNSVSSALIVAVKNTVESFVTVKAHFSPHGVAMEK